MDDAIIVMICKNESRYLREFIDYHLGSGFDRIVIGDNNDVDGERYEGLLKDYIDKARNDPIEIEDASKQKKR